MGAAPIDHEALARFLEDLGDDAPLIFDQLAELFLSDTPRLLQSLKDAVARRDFEGVKRTAHRMKGSSAQMGAAALAQDAEIMQTLAGVADPAGLQQTLGRIEASWQHTAAEVRRLQDCARRGDRAGPLTWLILQ